MTFIDIFLTGFATGFYVMIFMHLIYDISTELFNQIIDVCKCVLILFLFLLSGYFALRVLLNLDYYICVC
jgi:hypothetical protein